MMVSRHKPKHRPRKSIPVASDSRSFIAASRSAIAVSVSLTVLHSLRGFLPDESKRGATRLNPSII